MERQEFEDSVQRLWHQAERLLGLKNLDEADATAQELVNLLRDKPPPSVPVDPDYPAALGMLAYTKFLRGFADEADAAYAESIALSRQGGEASGIKLGRVLLSYGISLLERERFDEARAALADALEAMRPAAGRLDPQALDLLREVAQRAGRLGDWQLAEDTLLSVIEPFESRRPAIPMAAYYDSLTQVLLSAKRPDEAEVSACTALRMGEEAGMTPKDIATLLIRLADVLLVLGRHDDVVTQSDKAMGLAGEDHAVRYRCRDLQSIAYQRKGEFEEAIEALREVLAAANEAFGAYAPQTIELHDRLSDTLLNLQRYSEALPHLELLVAVTEARAGHHSADYADALADYALSLDQTGQYTDAQRYYRRALKLRRRLLGEKHPKVVVLRKNLAELARIRGEHELAERRFSELEDTLTQDEEADISLVEQTRIGYGLTLLGMHKYDEAADQLEKARDSRARSVGTDSPSYGRVLLAQAQLESARENHTDAMRLFGEAQATVRDVPGWTSWAEAAEIGLAMSRLHTEGTDAAMDDAVALLERVSERRGKYDRQVTVYRRNLALSMVRIGAFERARKTIERAEDSARFELIDALQSQIESRLSGAIDHLRQFCHLYLSLLVSGDARDEQSIRQAYEMLSSRGGAETTALRLRSRRFFHDDTSELQQQMRRLREKITRLRIQLDTTGERAKVEADIRRYQEELEEVELRLGASVNLGRLDLVFLGEHANTLALTIPEGTAVVEFTNYSRLVPGSEDPFAGEWGYAAFLIRGREEDVQFVDIGPSQPIDDLVERFRAGVMDFRSDAWREPGLALQKRIIEPLRPTLAGIDRLIVVPSGSIGLLPLASLPIDDHRDVIDDFEISYRFSSRRINGVLYEEDVGKGSDPAVIGAPDYGVQADGREGDPLADSEFLGQFRSGDRFKALPESLDECQAIAALLGVSARVGADANEEFVLELKSPEMLHISTHGFFMEERQKDCASGGGQTDVTELVRGRSSLSDSLDRSGLALAGANTYLGEEKPPPAAGDGILYASEVAGLDFQRTDLLTLSACQTGLGDVRSGDGVHGLQRAFTTAGARCIVCSLWEVPEIPTRKLFTRFYEEVLKGRPRGEAFHAVVRELADEYPGIPVAWGGFVLYGETGVLPRFDPARQINIVSMRMPKLEKEAEETDMGTPAQNVEKLIQDGYERIEAKDASGAIAAFTKAAEIKDAPIELRARAIYERAGVWRQAGGRQQALADYDWLEQTPGVPERRRVTSIGDRGTTLVMEGQFDEAAKAFTSVLDWQGLDLDMRAYTLVNRAFTWIKTGDETKALADLSEVIETPGMPPNQRAKALVNRSDLYINAGRIVETEADAKKALEIEEAMSVDIAGAHINYGRALAAQGRNDEAITSYDRALEVDNVPEHYSEIVRQLKTQLH